jgi:hypothetical protein
VPFCVGFCVQILYVICMLILVGLLKGISARSPTDKEISTVGGNILLRFEGESPTTPLLSRRASVKVKYIRISHLTWVQISSLFTKVSRNPRA